MRKLIAALAAFVTLFGAAGTALANASYFANGTATSAATSSPAYMTPGIATSTTPVYDAYAQTTNGGVTSKSDRAGLLVQLSASSTATVLNAAVEFSQDGIDWYRNFVVDPNQIATSTSSSIFSVNSPFSFTWKFASSTIGGIGSANQSLATAALLIPTPFRYTRVVFSLAGGNGAVWAQLVPIKERQ